MQDYLIVRSYIDPIEHDTSPTMYKLEVWEKLDRVARAIIRIHLSESVYYTVQACTTANELWKTLSDTYEKKVAATKIDDEE
jgi:transcription termination factor NusB